MIKIDKISLCMIVKDEEAVLERALHSVQSIVDEIIIVDTGSTDKTIEIAKKFTDKVFHFEWINDFSAARNFSLKQATKDWILIIDADEMLTEKEIKEIKALVAGAKESVVGFSFIQRNYSLEHKQAAVVNKKEPFLGKYPYYSDAKYLTRLIRRSDKIYFNSAIHEDVNPSIFKNFGGDALQCVEIPIHHLHVDKGNKFIDEKQKKYFYITKEAVKKTPSTKLFLDLATGFILFEKNYGEALKSLINVLELDGVMTTEKREKINEFTKKKQSLRLLKFVCSNIPFEKHDTNTFFNVTKALYEVGYYKEALVTIQALCAAKKDAIVDQRIVEYLGVCYVKVGLVAKAIEVFKSALKKDPGNKVFSTHLENIQNQLKQQQQ